MKIPTKNDCIHAPVCRYDDAMCPCDCGYFKTDLYGWLLHNLRTFEI